MLVKSFAAKTAASPATQRLHTPYAAARPINEASHSCVWRQETCLDH